MSHSQGEGLQASHEFGLILESFLNVEICQAKIQKKALEARSHAVMNVANGFGSLCAMVIVESYSETRSCNLGRIRSTP